MSIGHDQAVTLLGSLSSLIRATRAVAQRNSRELGASGTPLGVLKTLRAGATRPSDLAATLHVAPSVVSRAIVPLENEGLVERTTDPADGRATLLAITELGCQRLAQLQDAYVEQMSQLLADWTDGDAEQAATLMDRLEHALADMSAPEAHHRLLSTALIPTTLSPATDPSAPDPPAPGPPAPGPPAPGPPASDTPPHSADTDVDAPAPASTRKPVHA